MTDRTVVYRLQAETSQFKAQMAAAGASVKKAAGDMTAADKEGQKFRKGLDTLGGTAGKVGLVAAAGLGAAIVKAADFDAAMSNVSAATGETAANMDKLRQAALDAGAQTAFSATEAADGIEQLAKAGVSTESILNGGLRGALDLAAAGEMEVGAAAEVAAKAMAQFGLEGDQVPHIADLLASAAGNAAGEVSDFGYALSQSGLVANQVGLTLEETTGGLAAFAEAGLLGSDAGTSLKTMLGALTPNSTKAANTMDYLGLSAYDAQGNFVGLAEYAGRLQTALKGMTDEQRQSTMETLFGSDAVRAASVLYEQGADGMAKWIETVDDQGAAAEMASERLDNLKGDLEALGGALETALIGTGDGSQGALRGLTQGVTDVINKYNELPSAAQTATAAVMGGAALVGGSIWVGSKLVQGIANTRGAMADLGVTSSAVKGKLSGLVSFMGGPWGLALMTATVGLGAFMDQQAKTKGYVDSLRAALDDQSGAMTRSAIATNLNEEGWLEYADSIGVSAETVIDAALGSADAMDTLKAAAKADDSFFDLTHDAEQFITNVEAQGEAYAQAQKEGKLLAEASGDVATSLDGVTDANNGLTGSAFKSQEQLKAEADALKAARKAAAATAEQFFSVSSAVDAADGSVDKFIKSLEQQANALVNVRKNAELAAENGIRKGLIEQLEAAGPAGAVILEKLAKGTETQIGRANAAFRKGEQAKASYVNYKVPAAKLDADLTPLQKKVDDAKDRLDKLGAMKPSPKVDAQTAAAEAKLNNLLAMLREAERDRSSTVTTVFREIGKSTLGPQERADGGFIAGPGTATSDSIPAYLSNGEYVIKAAAVDKYGVHMFDRLNAMHFAKGGSTDKKKPKGPKHQGAAFDNEVNFGPGEQAQMQAAEAAEMYYAEQERAQREADQRAEDAAERQREHDEAVLEGQQRAWDQATDAAQAQVDAAQEMVDSVQQNMDRIGDVATQAFSGSWFTGEQQTGMWAGGAGTGDWRSQADADIAGLKERGAIISQLEGLGLTGTALEDLLGNESNAGIQAMIAAGDIDDYAAKFAEREALITLVGAQAGQAGYGSDMAEATGHLAEMNAKFDALTAAITAARPITVLEAISAQATAQELARLMSMAGAS